MKRSHQKNMDTTPNAKSFSLSLLSHNPHSNAAIKVLTDAWGEYVSEVGKDDFHIRADLTFRRGMMVNVAASAATQSVRYYKSISEEIAYQTISSFMNRMNYHAYKNAYKRYGKKLRVLSAVEGGKKDLRENTKSSDAPKFTPVPLNTESVWNGNNSMMSLLMASNANPLNFTWNMSSNGSSFLFMLIYALSFLSFSASS